MKHTAVLSGILLVLVLGLPVAAQGLIPQETMAPSVIGGVTPDLTMVTMVSPAAADPGYRLGEHHLYPVCGLC